MAGKLSKVNLNDYMPLREVVFNALRQAIIVGELKPGERLREEKLAEKMGVSRTPIREAIRKLELEGFVEMLPRKGAHVANLCVKDIMDVLEVRATLDGLATSLCAERITDSELEELKNINKAFSEYVKNENLQGSIKKDVEFHDIIYRSSRNDKLIQLINNLREQVQRFRIILLKDYENTIDLIKEHADIYEAVSSKNSDAARKAAQDHIKKQEDAIIKLQKSALKE